MSHYKAIVIGVSAGGMHALSTILPAFPADFTIPIIIVQHRSNYQDNTMLEKHLDQLCKLNVNEALPNEDILGGKIYIAPGGYHLMIEQDKIFSLSIDEPVNYSVPSIDVLFESAAEVYKGTLIGVILTGANTDGSKGLYKIKEMGGLCIAQDPETADTRIMPESAIKMTSVEHVYPLEDIGPYLTGVVNVS